MLKTMRKVPGGLLLLPMLVSAIFATFLPGFFAGFGSVTEALFTGKATNTIIGIVSLCASTQLDLSSIHKVLRKQGVLLVVKATLAIVLGFIFMKTFGIEGFWGISAIAFIPAVASLNPSIYLAFVTDCGVETDKAAFGLLGMLVVPAFPLFIFNLTQGGSIDWTPIWSTLIPTLVGIFIGNVDRELGNMLNSIVGVMLIFLGWSLGAGINILDAVKAGPQGVLLAVLFYVTLLPVLYLVETKGLKESGVSSLGFSSIAGLSVSLPSIIASFNPELAPIAATAAAQIAFGVIITSLLRPILLKRMVRVKGISKNRYVKEIKK